jgi:hypothetical protein
LASLCVKNCDTETALIALNATPMPTSCDYELSKLNSLKKPEIIGRKSKKWCAEKEYGDFILVNLPSMKLHGNYFIILSFNLCSAQTFKMSFLKSLRSLNSDMGSLLMGNSVVPQV